VPKLANELSVEADSTTSISRRITAAGSGRRRQDATLSHISGSSIRSRNQKNSTPKAGLSSAIAAARKAGVGRLAEPEVVSGQDYPAPIVDHAKARQRTLARFGK